MVYTGHQPSLHVERNIKLPLKKAQKAYNPLKQNKFSFKSQFVPYPFSDPPRRILRMVYYCTLQYDCARNGWKTVELNITNISFVSVKWREGGTGQKSLKGPAQGKVCVFLCLSYSCPIWETRVRSLFWRCHWKTGTPDPPVVTQPCVEM